MGSQQLQLLVIFLKQCNSRQFKWYLIQYVLVDFIWTSHIEDVHVADNLDRIGMQDLGPPGLQTWRARQRAPEPTMFQIPELPNGLTILRDLAYARRKVGRDNLQCFHLQYYLSHYFYQAHSNHMCESSAYCRSFN